MISWEVNYLSKDAILQIHEAEEKAREILGNAEKNKIETLENYKRELNLRYDDAISKAKAKKEEILAAAEKEAEDRSRPIIDKSNRRREEILSVSQDRFDNLVEDLVERIVK